MKRIIALSLLMLVISLLLPAGIARPKPPEAAPSATLSSSEGIQATSPITTQAAHTPSLAGQADSETVFTALIDGAPVEVTMSAYLPGALSGEMPPSFEREALKAQAVAARTYILYRIAHASSKHPDADVCGDAACCKAYLSEVALRDKWGDAFSENLELMSRAVSETDGQYLTYAGQVIQAVFHSSSASRTEDSDNLWQSLPYLVSVDSPETSDDVPNFVTTAEISAEDFKATILMLHADAYFDNNPLLWLGETSYYDSGRVENVKIGGVSIPGAELRTMFSLRSTAFSLDCTGDSFLFTVRGYGHGVGMSQYGANVMAGEGSGYKEILEHYYPGTELTG